MTMNTDQANIAWKLNSSKNNMSDADKMAKHLADLHNRRKTEENHALRLVENMWKERFSTVLSKNEFVSLYKDYKNN